MCSIRTNVQKSDVFQCPAKKCVESSNFVSSMSPATQKKVHRARKKLLRVRTWRWLAFPALKMWNVLLATRRCRLRCHSNVGAGSLCVEQVTLRVFPAQMYSSRLWVAAKRGLSGNSQPQWLIQKRGSSGGRRDRTPPLIGSEFSSNGCLFPYKRRTVRRVPLR